MSVEAAALVADIKRNSLDDGPGIRTVVFFKGCLLACQWCQNPETMRPGVQQSVVTERCIACGACRAACTSLVARPHVVARAVDGCRLCGACAATCPTGARRIVGTRYGVDELVAKLAQDEPFFRHSNGGVTLSGGEPALHPAYVGRVAHGLRSRGIHVLIETAGHFDWARFEEHLLPHLSAVYFDLKLADPDNHRRYTGQTNARILENLEQLVARGGPPVTPRVPLIPRVTDTYENLTALARILAGLGFAEVVLLPYNPLWIGKRVALGLDLPYDNERFQSPDEVRRCRDAVRAAGLTPR